MIQQFRTARGDIVIVQGEMAIMAAYQSGWEPVAPEQSEEDYIVAPAPRYVIDRDEAGVNYTSRIEGAFKRRATTARFTIDPKTGRIINEE